MALSGSNIQLVVELMKVSKGEISKTLMKVLSTTPILNLTTVTKMQELTLQPGECLFVRMSPSHAARRTST